MATEQDIDTLARTLFGESESNNERDAVAIASVIMNRVSLPNWPDTIEEVCLQSWQFSCWNENDPNRERILNADNRSSWFRRCQAIAEKAAAGKLKDPTIRSTHYYATYVAIPRWAKGKTAVYEVKHRTGKAHLFFNDIDTKAPQDDEASPLKPLTRSREVIGTTVAAVGTFGEIAITEAKDAIEPIIGYSDGLRWVFVGLVLAGLALSLYGRISNRRRGIV